MSEASSSSFLWRERNGLVRPAVDVDRVLWTELGALRIAQSRLGRGGTDLAERALDAALEDVRKGKTGSFPRHLQNMHADTYTQEQQQGYLYPHNYPNRWVQQQYLPDELVGTKYYEYGENKMEQAAKQSWDAIKKQ